MRLPPYVSYVSVDRIQIANLDREWTLRLRAAGLDVQRGWFSSYGSLAIQAPGADGRSSADEEEKLMALARLGVAFAVDYKQGMDPAGIMLDLCERGRYEGRFKQYGDNGRGPRIQEMPERSDRSD